MQNLAERRKNYRLPYQSKVIYTDDKNSETAYAINISRGGLFLVTLDPLPIDTEINILFLLSSQSQTLCARARVAHVVFDRQRSEVECGMGIQFLEPSSSLTASLNLHILDAKMAYLELRKILAPERPNMNELLRQLTRLPEINQDLTYLRYRVNRVCTLFDSESTSQIESPFEHKAG